MRKLNKIWLLLFPAPIFLLIFLLLSHFVTQWSLTTMYRPPPHPQYIIVGLSNKACLKNWVFFFFLYAEYLKMYFYKIFLTINRFVLTSFSYFLADFNAKILHAI